MSILDNENVQLKSLDDTIEDAFEKKLSILTNQYRYRTFENNDIPDMFGQQLKEGDDVIFIEGWYDVGDVDFEYAKILKVFDINHTKEAWEYKESHKSEFDKEYKDYECKFIKFPTVVLRIRNVNTQEFQYTKILVKYNNVIKINKDIKFALYKAVNNSRNNKIMKNELNNI